MTPSRQLVAAVQNHQTGQLEAADRLYREAIAADPNDMHALHLYGVLAHQTNRNDEAADLIGRAIALDGSVPDFHYNRGLVLWALGRRNEAAEHWTRVVALNPGHAAALMNLGNALREQGRFADAVAHLRRTVQMQPKSPVAHNNLGLALAGLGDAAATAHFQHAIELESRFLEPYLNLAIELARSGRTNEALACLARSLQVKETPDNTALFARIVGTLDAVGDDPALRALILRAATEGWGRAEDLAPVATTLVKHGSAVARGEAAWSAVASEPLLRWLLESTVLCDVDLERVLTATRTKLLEIAEGRDAVSDDQLRFACALARQCFNNEYVYAVTADEHARAARLREAILPLRLAVTAAYGPLHMSPNADALLAGSWPSPVEALLTQQVREPRDEALARAAIPRLTPVEDDTSRRVQAQYEENPYPRWVALGRPVAYDSIGALMRRELPVAPFRPTAAKGDLDILIAGCGTGRHSIEVAQQFPKSKVLAVDLSAASLAYATTRARALGVTNVEHAQADILRLGSIGRTFDMIQSVGVLHHLADPWAGWHVLTSLLRPGGAMFIALYSEIARRDVVAAREFIAQHGYGSGADDIRACRQELMAQPDGALKNVALFNDFFTTSECRDLLFHTQEQRTTLPAIKDFLAANGLTFLGFALDTRAMQRYAARFPADTAMTDLDNWDAFERDNPYTFAGMYRFWVQASE